MQVVGTDIQLLGGFRPPCLALRPSYWPRCCFSRLARRSRPWLFPPNFSALRLACHMFSRRFRMRMPQPWASLQSAIGGANLYGPAMLVTQLPGTTAPNILTTIDEIGFGPAGLTAYSDNSLLPPGTFAGSTGSFPYLMVTDQDVSDPSAIPDLPDPSGGFPIKIDGSFNWPGISWNQPGQGAPGGQVPWDVHDLHPIGVVLKITAGLFNPQDPTVLVQWTVTRTDTNAIVLSNIAGIGQAGAPGNIFAVTIDHGSASLQAADQFLVTCSLFRPLANGGTEQIFSSGNLFINIVDHFDRHHPYVQWIRPEAYIYPGQPFWNAIPPKAHVHGVKYTRSNRGESRNPSHRSVARRKAVLSRRHSGSSRQAHVAWCANRLWRPGPFAGLPTSLGYWLRIEFGVDLHRRSGRPTASDFSRCCQAR